MSQIRHWTFTIYEDQCAEPKIPLEYQHFKYAVYQKEKCPTTGKVHFQGYIEFNRSIRMKKVKDLFECQSMHLEPRQGTRSQARDYCMSKVYQGKDKGQISEPREFGVWDEVGEGRRSDLDTYSKAVREGKKDWELAEEYPVTFMRYSKHTQALRNATKPKLRDPPEVIVLWGETGVGKTRQIYEENNIEEIFKIEPGYQWFDGYQGQSVALFDEFFCQFKCAYLLQLLDRYPIRVPIKGGFVDWTPSKIYITSNIDPDSWYPNLPQASRDALKRRISKSINMQFQAEGSDLLAPTEPSAS